MVDLALNPFKKGKKTEVEGVRKVEVESDPLLQKVLKQYNSIEEGRNIADTEDYISHLEKIILHPAKINFFLHKVISKELIKGSEYFNSNIAGFYATKLIQDSYDKGNNNFILDTQDALIAFLGHGLKGKENNPINITIQGNTEDYCGQNSTNSHFTIQGNTRNYCGRRSKNSHFTIHGNMGHSCGIESTNSHFTIQGNTEDYCGIESTNSHFTIQGNTKDGCGWNSKNSTYKTSNQKTYEMMLEDVPKSNTIQLLGPNGEVLKEEKK